MKRILFGCLTLTLLSFFQTGSAQSVAQLAAPSETMLKESSILVINNANGLETRDYAEIAAEVNTALGAHFSITESFDARSREAKEGISNAMFEKAFTNKITYTSSVINGRTSIFLAVESYNTDASPIALTAYYNATGNSLEEVLSKVEADLAP